MRLRVDNSPNSVGKSTDRAGHEHIDFMIRTISWGTFGVPCTREVATNFKKLRIWAKDSTSCRGARSIRLSIDKARCVVLL